MRQIQPTRAKGSAAEILIVLLIIFLFVAHLVLTRTPLRRPIKVRQVAQLRSLYTALELSSHERDGYPPSEANDPTGAPYCGAMKLAEALMGRDLLGFHPNSTFRADGLDPYGEAVLYPVDPSKDNLGLREGPYIESPPAKAWRLVDIYGEGNTGPFPEDMFVLCDVYECKRPSGERIGMPILYYRADTKATAHDVNDPNDPSSIYDYRDNHAIVALGVPGDPNAVHPMADPQRFYLNTRDRRVLEESRPYRADTFILLSAGWDGLYGTADDVFNFEWKYRED